MPLKCLFQTGLDCRAFAARVFLGLKPLLPHMGADILDLLAQSPALVSEVRGKTRSARCIAWYVRSDVDSFSVLFP